MDYYKDKLKTLLRGLLILILIVTCADAATLTVGPGQTYTTIQRPLTPQPPGTPSWCRVGLTMST